MHVTAIFLISQVRTAFLKKVGCHEAAKQQATVMTMSRRLSQSASTSSVWSIFKKPFLRTKRHNCDDITSFTSFQADDVSIPPHHTLNPNNSPLPLPTNLVCFSRSPHYNLYFYSETGVYLLCYLKYARKTSKRALSTSLILHCNLGVICRNAFHDSLAYRFVLIAASTMLHS